ncbi:MAG: hypothetical protein INQ03_09910 [Candidatus Heimdallarchaeota archaeon]|nr:hypothetical protein [Candidatus Heimdallarchaeota archaeon]
MISLFDKLNLISQKKLTEINNNHVLTSITLWIWEMIVILAHQLDYRLVDNMVKLFFYALLFPLLFISIDWLVNINKLNHLLKIHVDEKAKALTIYQRTTKLEKTSLVGIDYSGTIYIYDIDHNTYEMINLFDYKYESNGKKYFRDTLIIHLMTQLRSFGYDSYTNIIARTLFELKIKFGTQISDDQLGIIKRQISYINNTIKTEENIFTKTKFNIFKEIVLNMIFILVFSLIMSIQTLNDYFLLFQFPLVFLYLIFPKCILYYPFLSRDYSGYDKYLKFNQDFMTHIQLRGSLDKIQ